MSENNYDDIINLPRYVSKTHKPLSADKRAAQFSPFAALTGYDDIIDEIQEFNIDESTDVDNIENIPLKNM